MYGTRGAQKFLAMKKRQSERADMMDDGQKKKRRAGLARRSERVAL